MPRTEVYQLRLTTEEKKKLALLARGRDRSIARMIREDYKLDMSAVAEEVGAALTPDRPHEVPYAVKAEVEAHRALVAKHKLRFSTATAERMARQELET